MNQVEESKDNGNMYKVLKANAQQFEGMQRHLLERLEQEFMD